MLILGAGFATFVAVHNSTPVTCNSNEITYVAQVGEVCQLPVDKITKDIHEDNRWWFGR
jgi:hypothetical protein